jgi:predicted RNase H-like HicB family nuclease
MSRYLIIEEETPSGYSVYSPDLPGCVAADSTRSDLRAHLGE